MPVATMTSKGQVTVPSLVRQGLGIGPGDQIDFVEVDGGYLIRPRSKSLMNLYGYFGTWDGPTVSVEQMNSDIIAAATRVNE